MNGNVNITLEELDSLRSDNKYLKDKVEELEALIEGLKDKSRVCVTRYDKVMPLNLKDQIIDKIIEIIDEEKHRENQRSVLHIYEGDNPYNITYLDRKKSIEYKISKIIDIYFDSNKWKDISQMSTKFINFEDVKTDVMKLYELEIINEIREKKENLDNREKNLKKIEKENEDLKNEYTTKLEALRIENYNLETNVYNKLTAEIADIKENNKILNDKNVALVNSNNKANITIEKLNSDISKLKKEVESFSETISFQKERIDKIKKSWWYKLFANNNEFEK